MDANAEFEAFEVWARRPQGILARLESYIQQGEQLLAKYGALWHDSDLGQKFGEENYPVAAAEMIQCHLRLKAALREAPERGLEGLVDAAFELGRLVERNDKWRFSVDPALPQRMLRKGEKPGIANRTSPESLALEARAKRLALPRQTAVHNARKAEAAAGWQGRATMLAGASGLVGGALVNHVQSRLKEEGYDPLPAPGTIRNFLGMLRRARKKVARTR